jgi:GT2 family glycosyltransferase
VKVLLGFVNFGLLPFTKLLVQSVRETTNVDIFTVVGKPGDTETINWLREQNIPHKIHDQNYGFPYSVNDLYDYAWKENDYDYLVIAGNDVILYPYCIDSLIHLANTSDYALISATQLDVRTFCDLFPHRKNLFTGSDFKFNRFDIRFWEDFKGYSFEPVIADMQLMDIQNCALYKKSVFETIGYTDVNFYPAYYIDNDYARRIANSNLNYCSLGNARFFHFWSRVIKQGTGGSTNHFFENNRKYYINKWGGDFGQETRNAPIKIETRDGELEAINYWRTH